MGGQWEEHGKMKKKIKKQLNIYLQIQFNYGYIGIVITDAEVGGRLDI